MCVRGKDAAKDGMTRLPAGRKEGREAGREKREMIGEGRRERVMERGRRHCSGL